MSPVYTEGGLAPALLPLGTLTKLLHFPSVQPARLFITSRQVKRQGLAIIRIIMQNVIEFSSHKSGKLNWNTITAVSLFHAFAIAALFTFSWQNLLAAFILW